MPENEDAAASSRANATARSKGCLDGILGAMAQDNVDVVRQFYEAYNARDESRWAPLLTSDFEFRSIFVNVEGRSYRGIDGVRQYFRDLADTWEQFQLEVEDIRDAGDDRVLGLMQIHGRGAASGVVIDPKIAAVFDMRDGRISRVYTYMDPDEALAAAGLRK